MYAKRFGKRKAVAAKRPNKRVPRKRSGGRQAIAKIVKSVMTRQAESKTWFDYGVNQSIITASTSVPTNINLVPQLSQGVQKSQRVGNEVTVKSGYIRGHVNILPYDVTLNNLPVPCYVKIFIVSQKVIQSNTLSDTVISSTFFDIGNSSAAFQGNMLDVGLTIDKDQWVLHGSKTIKLGSGYPSSTGPVGAAGYFDNSPMSAPFYFNFGKTLKKLKFEDTNTEPTNRNLWIIFQAVPANGASGASQRMAEFHYSTRVEYTDI